MTEKEENNVLEEAAVDDAFEEKDILNEEDSEKGSFHAEYVAYYNQTNNYEAALFKFCFFHNFPYVHKLAKHLLGVSVKDETINNMPSEYMELVRGDEHYKELTFFEQIHQNNFEKIYAQMDDLSRLTEDDRKNRQQVMDILGYDPFSNDELADRPQLYRDMAGLLNENMRKDVVKAKAAISIVRNYSNIDKYQLAINELTKQVDLDEDGQKSLDKYIKLQKTLQDSINATAEKNNFTVKGLGFNGKGTLSDVLTQIDEKGIDEGITNFYDIETSKAITDVAELSFKAQLSQVNFSATDYADILGSQCRAVRDAKQVARASLEGMRIAKSKIKKQELLEELELDYRKKGISESEIEEFIGREFNLTDGKDEFIV